ncbi:MAG: DUF1538 domain-containing protein [Treponema sp.]|nr:DUF1538 domain-containing protein [Treponema sp.]
MNVLLHKTKEVIIAVLPVVLFVVVLRFTIVPVENIHFFQFLIGALAVKIGLIILLFGIELAILPFGDHMGTVFVKSNKLWFIIITVFILGFFVNFAEPDVNVLAVQFANITNNLISVTTIRTLVALGAGMMLAFGAVRIVKNFSLRIVLAIAYTLAFSLALIFPDFMAIAFDASGAATGAITVPLVLALALGMASMKKDSISAEENSFGLVGLMAAGAIFGLLMLNFFIKPGDMTGVQEIPEFYDRSNLIAPFIYYLKKEPLVTLQSLLPIFLIFIFFQKFKLRLPRIAFRRIIMGFIYTYIGLVLFFVGVHAGFMEMGRVIGYELANPKYHHAIPIGLGAVLGMLIILTEPAVYVLTHQIEDVTSGYLKRKTVLTFLAIGMAFAVGLHVLKIIADPDTINLWHYILPGYAFALIMMFFTPKMFTGISFDSGAVSSGPMTVTFILAYSQGVAEAIPHADVLRDSFGVIVMVTMMPVIALQILGFIYKIKSRKVGV